MSELRLDPDPAAELDRLWDTAPRVAAVLEEVLDWIEDEPVDPRAKRRRFSNGMWAVVRTAERDEWLILWEEMDDQVRYVRYLGHSL